MKENNTWLKLHYRKALYPVILLFVLLAMIIPVSMPALAAVQQSFTTGDGMGYTFQGAWWMGQGFITDTAYTVSSVRLKLYRTTTYSGNITVSIRQRTDSGAGYYPSGSDLCAGTIDSSSITDVSPGAWYTISLADSVAGGTNLAAGTHYAIIVRATAYGYYLDDYVVWRFNDAQGYSGGPVYFSYSSGGSWPDAINTQGVMFEVRDNTSVQQSFTIGDDTTYNVNASNWIAQVFSTGSAYTVGSVRLKLIRTGTYSGTVTASIQQCHEAYPGEGHYHPDGTDQCVGTLDSTFITTTGAGAWYSIGLTASSGGTTNLAANTHYAIVVRATTDGDGTVGWRCNNDQGYSDDLKWLSVDSGVSWAGVTEVMMFEVLDSPPTYTVTYDGNGNTGGTVPTDSTAYHTEDTVTVLDNTGSLVKTGCDFSGWNTAAEGNGTDYTGNDTFSMGTSNVVLYAKWTYPTTVTLTGTKSARANQNVRLTAVVDVVASRANPTGTVTFYYATSPGGSTTQIDVAVDLVRGKAKLTTTFQSSDTYYVTASYSGNTGYSSSDSDPLIVTIK